VGVEIAAHNAGVGAADRLSNRQRLWQRCREL